MIHLPPIYLLVILSSLKMFSCSIINSPLLLNDEPQALVITVTNAHPKLTHSTNNIHKPNPEYCLFSSPQPTDIEHTSVTKPMLIPFGLLLYSLNLMLSEWYMTPCVF